ncbi:MAG TPA: hypothetical protein VKH41_16420 [Myxococcota bacterium]|nr:hypothetical protein [Myxococcota bacterium]
MTARAIDRLRELARRRVPRRDAQAFQELWGLTFAEASADARHGEGELLWQLACNTKFSTRRGPMSKPWPNVPARVRAALVERVMSFDEDEDDSDLY